MLNAQTVLGAYGLVRGLDMERRVRDILILPIAGGSSAIQKNNIASSLGLPKAREPFRRGQSLRSDCERASRVPLPPFA